MPAKLEPEQIAALRAGRAAAKPILRAATLAGINGWTLAVFGGITLLGVLFGSWMLGFVGTALVVIAVNEFRGASRVRKLDASGARLLGMNETALTVLIVAYCAWRAYTAKDSELSAALDSAGSDPVFANMKEIVQTWTIVAYAMVAVLGGGLTALNAWYSHRRVRMIQAFTREHPDWVVEALRATA